MKRLTSVRCFVRGGGFLVASMMAAAATAAPSNLLFTLDDPGPLPGGTNSQFGAAVTANKQVILVGAPNFDNGGTDTGAAFGFDPKTGTLLGMVSFGSNVVAGDHVGTAIVSNTKYVIYGAPGTTVSGQSGAGRVYVIPSHGSGFFIDDPTPGANEGFGSSLALYGDVLVIGAPKDASGGIVPVPVSGGAYVVNLKTSVVPVSLLDPDAASGDKFGFSVAVSKKYIAVGIPERGASLLTGVGAVALFDAKTLGHLGSITNPNLESGAEFGAAVALGTKVLAVGAPQADRDSGFGTIVDVGRVYEYDAGTRGFLRELVTGSASIGTHFGSVLATDGKLLLIGAPGDPGGTSGEGATASFLLTSGAFIRENVSEHPVTNGSFGSGIAVIKGGNYVVGAPQEEDGSSNVVGRAYVYKKFTARAR